MTWKHVSCIIGALALPVLCGFSATCSGSALEKVIGLSSILIAGVLGHARSETKGAGGEPG